MIFSEVITVQAHTRELSKRLQRQISSIRMDYSLDPHCENAAALIKKRLGDDSLDIHFTVGGTITNLTAIAAWLRPYQAAVSVASGHIYVHETGAIEATGHKVIAMPGKDGKLTPDDILAAVAMHTDEHMVQPKLSLYFKFYGDRHYIYKSRIKRAARLLPRKRYVPLYGRCASWLGAYCGGK